MIKDVNAKVYDPQRNLKGNINGRFDAVNLYFVSEDEEYQIESDAYVGDKFIKNGDFLKIDGKLFHIKEQHKSIIK